jgi:hypothetical protein
MYFVHVSGIYKIFNLLFQRENSPIYFYSGANSLLGDTTIGNDIPQPETIYFPIVSKTTHLPNQTMQKPLKSLWRARWPTSMR